LQKNIKFKLKLAGIKNYSITNKPLKNIINLVIKIKTLYQRLNVLMRWGIGS
jgi:hypothetical protein